MIKWQGGPKKPAVEEHPQEPFKQEALGGWMNGGC